MKFEREKWLDCLKGFAMFCIILGHSIERIQTGLGYSNGFLYFIDVFVNGMHIYIFFMVSGYLYAKIERDRIKCSGGDCPKTNGLTQA